MAGSEGTIWSRCLSLGCFMENISKSLGFVEALNLYIHDINGAYSFADFGQADFGQAVLLVCFAFIPPNQKFR